MTETKTKTEAEAEEFNYIGYVNEFDIGTQLLDSMPHRAIYEWYMEVKDKIPDSIKSMAWDVGSSSTYFEPEVDMTRVMGVHIETLIYNLLMYHVKEVIRRQNPALDEADLIHYAEEYLADR